MKKVLSRKKLRLKDFDYSSEGAYFITICTKNRENFFGEIVDDKMVLNGAGEIVEKYWQEIPRNFSNTELGEFCVMPNHIHGIIWVVGTPFMGVQKKWRPQGIAPTDKTISEIIGAFKSLTTNKYIRGVKNGEFPPFEKQIWQRSFHDRIIRDNKELKNITEYIKMNPENWEKDEEFMKL